MIIDKQIGIESENIAYISKDDIKKLIKWAKLNGAPVFYNEKKLQKFKLYIANNSEYLEDEMLDKFHIDHASYFISRIYDVIINCSCQLHSFSASNKELINLIYINVNPVSTYNWQNYQKNNIDFNEREEWYEQLFKIANKLEHDIPGTFNELHYNATINIHNNIDANSMIKKYGILNYYSCGAKVDKTGFHNLIIKNNDNIKNANELRKTIVNKFNEYSHDQFYKLMKELHQNKSLGVKDVNLKPTTGSPFDYEIIIKLDDQANLSKIDQILKKYIYECYPTYVLNNHNKKSNSITVNASFQS